MAIVNAWPLVMRVAGHSHEPLALRNQFHGHRLRCNISAEVDIEHRSIAPDLCNQVEGLRRGAGRADDSEASALQNPHNV